MKSKSLIILLAAVTLACGLFIVRGQEPDDDIRGAFLSTRPKTTNANATRRHRPPRRTSSNTSANSNTGNAYSTNANNKNATNRNNAGMNAPAQAIGLGYTLFMRDANGRSVRVEPGHEFHAGDRVRISLEPNVDGYLYVFHTEGEGPAEMLYPDMRLDAGENWIEAHVPLEVPSSEQADERFHWFVFDRNAAIERLYVVVSREPLRSVLTGSDLINFCAANKDKCPWHPPADVWAQIQDATKAEVKVVTSKTFGQSETDKEKTATTRGLGLDQTAPQPAVIRMNAATNAALLVTVLDLVHR